ncbi:hypothetical protein GOODEAATRI_018070 [Goodea atripinnis]|uniref:Uncharacterized protein n=1 Tax=Goodea atripinnis TaxID=208336 RepID=A0ABV0MV03_9TELE
MAKNKNYKASSQMPANRGISWYLMNKYPFIIWFYLSQAMHENKRISNKQEKERLLLNIKSSILALDAVVKNDDAPARSRCFTGLEKKKKKKLSQQQGTACKIITR